MQNFPSDTVEQIRLFLEDEKKRVQLRIQELSAQDPFSDPDRSNDNAASDTEATEESNHDRYVALVEQLKSQLKDLDASLVRIGDGKYGFCTNCGQLIDTDRLAILPTATLCLNCQINKAK